MMSLLLSPQFTERSFIRTLNHAAPPLMNLRFWLPARQSHSGGNPKPRLKSDWQGSNPPERTVRYGPARSVQAGGKVPPQADCKVFLR